MEGFRDLIGEFLQYAMDIYIHGYDSEIYSVHECTGVQIDVANWLK